MKVENIKLFDGNGIQFKGKRVNRNNVAQLAQNNPYSLTEPNQRLITNSIAEMGKTGDLKTVKFLMETAAKSKYTTNIVLKDTPKNNWKGLLLTAAAAAAALIPTALQANLTNKIARLSKPQKLNETEKEILQLREQLLGVVNLEQVNKEMKGPAKDFAKNLDYFIISSETTLDHKKYVLEKLNYLMSDDYEINPQLKDKKSIVAAEMINDMTISAPGSNIPNIKAVNQKQHGMCAAISIVRKKVAYEDKPNYVDSILSELDSSNKISVYDRNSLGTGKKIFVEKIPVDFATAIENGYRIIDTATMYWMQIAAMSGANNISYDEYNPFDKENFDVKTDSFLNVKFEDPELEKAQSYYQALILAKSYLEDYKADRIKSETKNIQIRQEKNSRQNLTARLLDDLKNTISNSIPEISKDNVRKLAAEIIGLEKPISSKITNPYQYIPNEEDTVKQEKIKNLIIKRTQKETISDKDTERIFEIVEQYNSVINDKAPKVTRLSRISQAKDLYKIAASFRYVILKGLEEPQTLESIMITENISNKEELLINHINTLIKKLENNSPDSDRIISQIHPSFEELEPTRENMIEGLKALKEIITSILTDDLDEIYQSLALGDRKTAITNILKSTADSIQNGDTKTMAYYSEQLGVKKDSKAVVKALNKIEERISSGDEKAYSEAFRLFGNTSQLEYILTTYHNIVGQISEENNKEIVLALLEANNLKIADDEHVFINRLQEIENEISSRINFLDMCTKSLKIVDENGRSLYSAYPQDVIVKKLENENRIASAKTLSELQEHFTKITQDRASDEFQSRQGKLKDKSLYNFSASENGVLKETHRSINQMNGYIQNQLNEVRSDIKESLEDLKRIVGVNNGDYWVMEGSSGLSSEKQARILEYMTGRPHYITTDLKKAFEQIKATPYSGITGSSVFHNKAGFHAQYVADIAPVTVRVKDNNGSVTETQREVLFQDNTWGASELENTWIDSNGLTRTDYSDNRGGSLGYITNDEYRNGNFVDRILNEMTLTLSSEPIDNKVYKKIRKPRQIETMMQYRDTILDGKSPKIKDIAASLHDAIFVPNDPLVKKLYNIASKYTYEELSAMITNRQYIGKNWKKTYETLKQRIFPIVGEGIKTQEDYDKLADDDYLKVVLEKIALKRRAQITGLEPALAKVRKVSDLSKINAAQKTRATNSFKYSFAKTPQTVTFLAEAFGKNGEEDEFDNILAKYNIKITDDEYNSIGERFSIDLDKFDGSAKTTINLIMENLNKELRNVIKNPEARAELRKFYRDYLTRNLYFNKSDLDMYELDNQKIEHIVKFIDRVFDPADDEEFVKIYNRIQDMTTEEFSKEILSKATPQDLGIQPLTGFDILQELRTYNDNTDTDFINTVYYDIVAPENGNESYQPSYKYSKLFRTARYTPLKNFNTIYRDLSNDLSILTLPKLFDKYKGRNLEKYNAYPAYPKFDVLSESYMKSSYDYALSIIEENIHMIKTFHSQLENYEIAETLEKFIKEVKPESVIKGDDYTYINNLMGRLITLNMNDPAVKDANDAAEAVLNLEEKSTWNEYLPHIQLISKRLTDFKASSPEEKIYEIIEEKMQQIHISQKAFLDIFIIPKNRNRLAKLLSEFEQALIKENIEAAEELKAQVIHEFRCYHILQDPEELLKQYIKSCASNSPLHQYNATYEKILERAIGYAKLAEVQSIIMDAVGDSVALNAKSKFDSYTLELSSGEVSMGSDEMISHMTNQLVIDDDYQTALLFLEKLGLGETYTKYTAKNLNYDYMTQLLEETHEIASNYENFSRTVKAEVDRISPLLDKPDSDCVKLIDGLTNVISEAGITNKIADDAVVTLMAAMETIKDYTAKNPRASRQVIFVTLLDSAQQKAAEIVQASINDRNTILESTIHIANLINQTMLPEESEAEQARIEMNKKIEALLQRRDELVRLHNQ